MRANFDMKSSSTMETFRYRRVKEKKPLVETMGLLMPMLLERLITLMPDASQESCLLQKLILKIFYGLVQVLNWNLKDIILMLYF